MYREGEQTPLLERKSNRCVRERRKLGDSVPQPKMPEHH